MHLIDPKGHTRRAFLQRSSALAMAGTAMPFAVNLSAMSEAAAQTATDYKALVCVFLFGGNDYANTVITYDDDSYGKYSTIRVPQASGGVAIPKDAALAATLLSPTVPLANGRQYALHPSMTELANLFNSTGPTGGKVAVQLNVGPLVVPLSRAGYNNSNKKLYPQPPKLFSHNDQQSTWQSSSPEGSTVGWGGNVGDLVLNQNSNSLFTCMSVSGNAVFLSGDSALQYQVSTGGAVRINSVSPASSASLYSSTTVKSAMQLLTQQARGHKLENEYTRVTKRAVEAEGAVTAAIGSDFPAGTFPNPATGLGRQLAMVARLIRGRSQLGAKRQVFFVSMGGFDLHDNLVASQPTLMQQLSDGLATLPGPWDLILCNPPYVNAQSMAALPPEYRAEPELALAGGTDGMDFIRRLLREASACMSEHAVLVLEIGNERAHFEAAFPALPVFWLDSSAGEHQVLLISLAALTASF